MTDIRVLSTGDEVDDISLQHPLFEPVGNYAYLLDYIYNGEIGRVIKTRYIDGRVLDRGPAADAPECVKQNYARPKRYSPNANAFCQHSCICNMR